MSSPTTKVLYEKKSEQHQQGDENKSEQHQQAGDEKKSEQHTLATVVLTPSQDLKHLGLAIGTWTCVCPAIHGDYDDLSPLVISFNEWMCNIITIHTFLEKFGVGIIKIRDSGGKNHYFEVPIKALNFMQIIMRVETAKTRFVEESGNMVPVDEGWKPLLAAAFGGVFLGVFVCKIL